MAIQKKPKTDDEPFEEFLDDNRPDKNEKPSNIKEKEEKENYNEWTLEQLQIEAQRQGVAEGMTMNKEQLIKKLRNKP